MFQLADQKLIVTVKTISDFVQQIVRIYELKSFVLTFVSTI